MSDLITWALIVLIGLPVLAFLLVHAVKRVPVPAGDLDAALVGELPVEVEPDPIKKSGVVVLGRTQVGLALVELQQEFKVTAGVPRIRRRRTVVVSGYVTSEADAKALGDAIKSYGLEI